MENEINSLNQNKKKLVDVKAVPEGKKIIQVKWIYKIKADHNFKARLVALGYQQPKSIEEAIYLPVAKMPTLKSLLSVACNKGWYIE